MISVFRSAYFQEEAIKIALQGPDKKEALEIPRSSFDIN
jgi:hypothetical protein